MKEGEAGPDSALRYVHLPGIKVQPRDLSVLRFVAKHRFTTAEIVRERFWPGAKESAHAHLRRLRKLQRAGFVAPFTGDLGVHLGYCLTRRGREFLGQCGDVVDEGGVPRRHYKTTYEHDLLLTRIRETFEASPLVFDFVPEHELRRAAAKNLPRRSHREKAIEVADAEFTVKTQRGEYKILLELELTRKADQRYEKKFRRLVTRRDVSVALFIVRGSPLLAKLTAVLREAGRQSLMTADAWKEGRFAFALLEDFQRLGRACLFEGGGQTFSLAELEKKAGAKTPSSEAPWAHAAPST